jgi:predicted RecB family nuclease
MGIDGLKRVTGRSGLGEFHYIPLLYDEGATARQVQKRILEGYALVLGEVQATLPDKGILVDPEKLSFAGIRLEKNLRTVRSSLDELSAIAEGGTAPELTLNSHCRNCEFQRRCKAQALAEDNLSLLKGLGEKQIAKFRKKGVATITQLSYTYRARRVRSKDQKEHRAHSVALQAMAIREHRVYVLGNPVLPDGAVRIYFDIEGDPERYTAYLLGMIVDELGSETRLSFWSDTSGQEENIVVRFLNAVESLRDSQLFCYGNFEVAFLKTMKTRRPELAKRIDPILGRTTNILPIIYSSVYFPVHSNGLKEIGGHLGFRWSEPDASGLQCTVWRRKWEATHDEGVRRRIEVYNLEDCAALRKVVRFLDAIGTGRATDSTRHPDEVIPGYSRLEDTVIQFSHRDWCNAKFSIADFETINNLSYFDYQRDRVFVRSSNRLRKARSAARKCRGRVSYRINKRVQIRCHACPLCGSAQLTEWQDGRVGRVVKDLEISAGGIRRRFIRVTSPKYRCETCHHVFFPPEHLRIDTHSHSLKSWAMYEHLAHRTSFASLQESLGECFGHRVPSTEIHGFKHLMARYYDSTLEGIRSRIVTGNMIHADETDVNVHGVGKGYVWVFTNLEEVLYLYKPSREGRFLNEFLDGLRGVLVSDFYAAYDSLPCNQQKCLIHLIRDFNHDIVANPFDEELKSLAAAFGQLLRGIVTTIDRHGLNRRHLGKHQRRVDQFFEKVSGQTYRCEVSQAYQKRLERYRSKLFEFLDHDGVPWNNNNAEHAVRAFAHYREIADGVVTEGGLKDYLVLLSIYQTCVYKGVSFLKFLVSQERDIDRFCEMGSRRQEKAHYDLYPEGYIPPRRRRRPARDDVESAQHRVATQSNG